jgi:hypothetical protein
MVAKHYGKLSRELLREFLIISFWEQETRKNLENLMNGKPGEKSMICKIYLQEVSSTSFHILFFEKDMQFPY